MRIRVATIGASFACAMALGLFQNCGKFQSSNEFSKSELNSQDPILNSNDPLNANVFNGSMINNGDAEIEIQLNKPDSNSISIDWHTVEGTAKAGEHFSTSAGTLVIAAGSTAEKIKIPVIHSDPIDTAFFVVITSTSKGSIGRAQGIFTIRANVLPYDPKWHPMSSTGAPSNLLGYSFWTGSKVLVYNSSLPSASGIFDPATNAWSSMTSVGAPTPRSNPSVTLVGTKLLVWGGTSASSGALVNDGAVYDSVMNTWSAMSTTNALSPRYFPSIVVGGSKVFFFGGHLGNNQPYASGGAIFDTATNTWSTLSTVNAPSARAYGIMHWTGSKLIVWGGSTIPNGPNGGAVGAVTGGIYDPQTNSWKIMNTTGSPSARIGEAQVWTGSKVLVFGGYDINGAFNNGAMYDPNNDNWTAMSSVNAPQRWLGSAGNYSGPGRPDIIWTGTKMLMFGYLNAQTTGIFDPATNSWTAMNLANAPSERGIYASIWTGSKFIVYGGSDLATFTQNLAGGAIYDSATNSWMTMNLTNAPMGGRSYGTSHWTGKAYILFGGYSMPNYVGNNTTGGIFY